VPNAIFGSVLIAVESAALMSSREDYP
jgi:hypothetical protein